MSLQQVHGGFRRFRAAAPERLHFAAHSHHPWPDVAHQAHEQAWTDAMELADDKWEKVFDEVLPALEALAQQGIPMAVATSKPEHTAIEVLGRLELARYFVTISGASRDETISDKASIVGEALRRLNADGVDTSNPVMVGDRLHDVVEVALVAVRTVADAPQNAAREPRFEVRAQRERQVAGETDAAIRRRDVPRTELFDFGGERRLEPARAGREIPFGHGVRTAWRRRATR